MNEPLTRRESLRSGLEIGRYTVERRLARGGMAELYLARARGPFGFNKLCVIKLVLPHLTEDARFVSMFLHEARLLASLDHAHIAQVIDIGEFERDPYFVMQYVHGRDLRTVMRALKGQPLDLPVALRVASSVASGLAYAHEKTDEQGQPLGLVHRDVSPANVMIGYGGDVKLVDFGVAKSAVQDEETRTGVIKGKAAYMSPEQCRGDRVDHRSDIFALGILLYEMTTGQRLFHGSSDFVMMQKIVEGEVPSPHDVCDDYPPGLTEIVMRALHPDPEQRTPNAATLLGELQEFARVHNVLASELDISNLMESLFEVPLLEATAQEATQARGLLALPTGAGPHDRTSATSLGERVELELEPELEAQRTVAVVATPPVVPGRETTVAPTLLQTQLADPPMGLAPATVVLTPAPVERAPDELDDWEPPPRVRTKHLAALAVVVAVGAGAWALRGGAASSDPQADAPATVHVASDPPPAPHPSARHIEAGPPPTPAPDELPPPEPEDPIEGADTVPDDAPVPVVAPQPPAGETRPRAKKRPRKRPRTSPKSNDGPALDSMYP